MWYVKLYRRALPDVWSQRQALSNIVVLRGKQGWQPGGIRHEHMSSIVCLPEPTLLWTIWRSSTPAMLFNILHHYMGHLHSRVQVTQQTRRKYILHDRSYDNGWMGPLCKADCTRSESVMSYHTGHLPIVIRSFFLDTQRVKEPTKTDCVARMYHHYCVNDDMNGGRDTTCCPMGAWGQT